MLCIITIGWRLIMKVTKLCNDTNGEYTQSCGEQNHRRTKTMEGNDGKMSKVRWIIGLGAKVMATI